MSFITTADQRLAVPAKVNSVIVGPSGIGKTSLVRTLPNAGADTLFLDGEGGMLAVNDDILDAAGNIISPRFAGDSIDLKKLSVQIGRHPWELCRAIACLLAGPDMSDYELQPNGLMKAGPYAPESYEAYKAGLGGDEFIASLAKYNNIFVDSITVTSRWAFSWANTQPDRISDKGKVNKLGAYGLLGQEMIKWLTVLQHVPDKSIFVVGILDRDVDDLKRVTYSPQIEGSKAGRELPGIFDQVIAFDNIEFDGGVKARAFVTSQANPWGYPAKDRSGRLDMVEEPHLGKMMDKIRNARRVGQPHQTTLPQPQQTPAVATDTPVPPASAQ